MRLFAVGQEGSYQKNPKTSLSYCLYDRLRSFRLKYPYDQGGLDISGGKAVSSTHRSLKKIVSQIFAALQPKLLKFFKLFCISQFF